jgi:predicted glutamine amidotransferase
MCRMFAYAGSSQNDLIALYDALRAASTSDPSLRELYPSSGGRHRDGWGYIIRTSRQLFHYRTERPIDESTDHRLPELDGEILAIFHSRFTSGVKGDAIFSHPFMASTGAATLFLAHNGGLLAEVLEGSPHKVDSEWALDEIVAEGGLAPALDRLKAKTKTALNLFLMSVHRNRRPAAISYLNYYKGYGETKSDAYYRLFQASMPDGGRAVFSSTLRNHLMLIDRIGDARPVEYDRISEL